MSTIYETQSLRKNKRVILNLLVCVLYFWVSALNKAQAQLPLQNIPCTGCSATASTGYATASAAVAGAGAGLTNYTLNPNTTFTQCATIKTDVNGTVGILNQIQTNQPTGNTACINNTAASRRGSLYLKSSGGACTGPEIQAVRKGSNSSTFNPEYIGLTPNTDYILVIRTTVDGSCNQYQSSSVRYYGSVSPQFVYNCSVSSVAGSFIAGTGSSGTLTIGMTGALAGLTTFNVSGTGFTGTLATTLTAGQTSVTIPITYDGTGTTGTRVLTVTSSGGSGTCTKNVLVDKDTDGDGIANATDIDDDNDGILDVIECPNTNSVYTMDPAATSFTGVGTDGGFFDLTYKLTSGIAVVGIGASFVVRVTYTDFINTLGTDNKWASGVTAVFGSTSYAGVSPNVATLYAGRPAANQQAEANGSGGTDQDVQALLTSGAIVNLGTFGVTIAPLPTAPSGYTLVSQAIDIFSVFNLGGSTNYGNGYYAKPQLQTSLNTANVANNLPYSGSHGQTYTFDYTAFSDGTTIANAGRGLFAVQNGTVTFSQTCDTDNDGIANSEDLDSDGDGCSDAFEGGATTSLTANFKFTTAVGANGLVNTKETNDTPTAAVNYTVTYGNAISSTVKSCTDTDGDGIADTIDIDDDNDGVLDSVECVKATSTGDGKVNYKVWDLAEISASGDPFYSSTTQHRNAPTGTFKYGDFPDFTSSSPTISGSTAVVFGQLPWVDIANGGTNPNNGSFTQIEGFIALPCYANSLQMRTLASGTPASAGTVREDFTTLHLALSASGDATTNTTDLKQVSYQKVNFSGTVVGSTEYTFANTNSSGKWIAFGDAVSDGADFYGAIIQWNIDGAGWVNIPATAFNSAGTSLLAGCVCADTDNDGIPNYLDLDSDGDGCSDAYEAAATTSLTANFKFTTAVGTNGLANSLETNDTPTAAINYTSTYSKALDNTIKTCIPPVTANTPAPKSGVANSPKTGNAATELVPVGGNGTYVYSVDNSASCTPVSGATALPSGSNLTVTNASTGAYTFTTPATAGTYYYCIKVCDTATPTPSCVTKTYTLTVTAAPTPLTAVNPPAQTATPSQAKTGNAATELTPAGGDGNYVYSVDNSASCIAPSGVTTALPTASNLTVTNSSTGTYTYTAPATAGTYYYCIKVCDTTSPTPNCLTKTYTLTVAAPACPLGTTVPGLK